MLDAGEPEQLGHLRDVPEHVGEVPDGRGPAQLAGAGDPELEVAHDRLARHHELVHEDHPRADREPLVGDQSRQAGGSLGPHLEVVVDHRGLPVEQEAPGGGILLEQVEEPVEQRHELGPIHLERRVPLPVPVRVRHDRDLLHALARCSAGYPPRGRSLAAALRTSLRSCFGATPIVALAHTFVQARPNHRSIRLAPNSAFCAASSSDGALNAPVGVSPARKTASTKPTWSSPNSM